MCCMCYEWTKIFTVIDIQCNCTFCTRKYKLVNSLGKHEGGREEVNFSFLRARVTHRQLNMILLTFGGSMNDHMSKKSRQVTGLMLKTCPRSLWQGKLVAAKMITASN